MRSRAARNRPCSSGGRSTSSGTGNQEMRSSASSIALEPTIAPMTRLLTAFLIVLGLLPATASAAAPPCPDDNADEFGGSGDVVGGGRRYVIAGVPRRAESAGAIVVRDGNHTPGAGPLATVPGA